MARSVKNERQLKILEIVDEQSIASIKDLQAILETEGFKVDRTSMYKDAAELHLIVAARSDGTIGLTTPDRVARESIAERLAKMTVEAAIDIDILNNMVKIRCIHGCADAVVTAIDSLHLASVFCSVLARDDALIICKSEESAEQLYKLLGRVISK